MDATETTTVGEIAARIPASIRVFEHYGIDFCCNGRRPLREAVAGTGVSAATLLSEIDRAVVAEQAEERNVRDWTAESPAALSDHIVQTHHALLERELPAVGRDLAKIVEVHGANHPELAELQRLYEALRAELEDHLRKEEELVFPALRQLRPGEAPSPLLLATLEDLEAEHDAAGAALHAIRGITSNYQTPPDACATYSNTYRGLQALEADIHRHVHLENNILIPGVRALLEA